MQVEQGQSVAIIGLKSMGTGAAKSCFTADLAVYDVDLNDDALTQAKGIDLDADTFKGLKFPLALESTALNMFISASDVGFEQQDDSAVIKIFSGITIPKKGE